MSKFILSAFADEIDVNLTTQMDVLKEHEIEYIEMRGVNGKGLVEYSLDEVKDIKRQLDERGFKLSAIGSPIGKIKITDNFTPHLELFNHTIEIAKRMECKYIRMFSFYIPKEEQASKYRDEVMKRWDQFIDAARGTDLVLLHENEKGIYGDTAERCLDLIETIGSKQLRAIFDPSNFVQCDEETYPKSYEILKDYIEYMHIKDALSSDHSVVPAGHGDGKIKEILTALYKKGFKGFLSLEPHLGKFEGFASLEPDTVVDNMPDGGPKLFAIATKALKKIIKEVENN